MLKWKRIVWISVILIIIIPVAAVCFGKFIKSQDRGGVDEAGIKWQYNTFTKVLEFSAKESSNGKMKNYWDEEKAPWWKYAKHCRKVIFGKGIKYIGKRTCSEFNEVLGCDVWARDEKLEHICVKTLFFHSFQDGFCDVNPEVHGFGAGKTLKNRIQIT